MKHSVVVQLQLNDFWHFGLFQFGKNALFFNLSFIRFGRPIFVSFQATSILKFVLSELDNIRLLLKIKQVYSRITESFSSKFVTKSRKKLFLNQHN